MAGRIGRQGFTGNSSRSHFPVWTHALETSRTPKTRVAPAGSQTASAMNVRKLKRRLSTALQLDASVRVDTNRHMASMTLEPLEDMVTCPIDLNFLVDPRLLPCGHAFCCDCLTGYMSKLKVDAAGADGGGETATFACPICRAACSLPSDRRGESLQKAFNHTVILEFVRNTRLSGLGVTTSSSCGLKENAAASATVATANGGRKSSIQVSSHMLNLIVQDITTRQRDGKISITDRTVILDEVNRLIGQLQTTNEGTDKARITPAPDPPMQQSPTVSSVSPSSSTRNLGRFHRFAARIRSPLPSQKLQVNSCQLEKQKDFKDVRRIRTTMKRNACYCVITKVNEHDLVQSDVEYQPIDGYHNLIQKPALSSISAVQLDRLFLTVDRSHSNLILRRQVVSSYLQRPRSEDKKHNGLDQNVLTCTGPLRFLETARVRVQYLRILGEYVYLTAVTYQQTLEVAQMGRNYLTGEVGFLIKCSIREFNEITPSKAQQTRVSETAFPVTAVSCPFTRDEVGVASRHHPLVLGLDVDRSSGDVYVTQPANGMICRLKSDRLDQTDGTWYFNDSQLAPYFLCYAASTNSVWATCPSEGKIVILDLESNSLFQFTPSVCFGINPSHVVQTTDGRVMVLDKRQSCLYWITKVDQTICFQSIQVKTQCKLPDQLTVIQPAADIGLPKTNGAHQTLTGGIFCIGDSGCLLLYPKKQCDSHRSHTSKVCFR